MILGYQLESCIDQLHSEQHECTLTSERHQSGGISDSRYKLVLENCVHYSIHQTNHGVVFLAHLRVESDHGGSKSMHFPCVAPHRVTSQCRLADSREVGAVDGLQLVTVRGAHEAHADHTGQSGGEGVAAEGGGRGHGAHNLDTLHANKLQVGVIEAIVCDQLGIYVCIG